MRGREQPKDGGGDHNEGAYGVVVIQRRINDDARLRPVGQVEGEVGKNKGQWGREVLELVRVPRQRQVEQHQNSVYSVHVDGGGIRGQVVGVFGAVNILFGWEWQIGLSDQSAGFSPSHPISPCIYVIPAEEVQYLRPEEYRHHDRQRGRYSV